MHSSPHEVAAEVTRAPMELYLVRHGQTDLNKLGKYQGSIETDLNWTGITQARRIARKLPARIDALVTSPMRRARQTADIIARQRTIAVQTMPEFRERCVGVFEGLSKAEIKSRFPRLWSNRLMHRFDAAPPGGETLDKVLRRVRQGIERLHAVHDGGCVVVVAHGCIARAVWALVTRAPRELFFDYTLANGECAIHVVADAGAPSASGSQP